jgi:hypothetical protein
MLQLHLQIFEFALRLGHEASLDALHGGEKESLVWQFPHKAHLPWTQCVSHLQMKFPAAL